MKIILEDPKVVQNTSEHKCKLKLELQYSSFLGGSISVTSQGNCFDQLLC